MYPKCITGLRLFYDIARWICLALALALMRDVNDKILNIVNINIVVGSKLTTSPIGHRV